MRIDNALLPLGVNPDTMTISGYSLGSYMATEIAVIHSSKFQGLGIIGGGLYEVS